MNRKRGNLHAGLMTDLGAVVSLAPSYRNLRTGLDYSTSNTANDGLEPSIYGAGDVEYAEFESKSAEHERHELELHEQGVFDG